jgi:GPI ethanolamine phosphate transferase 1
VGADLLLCKGLTRADATMLDHWVFDRVEAMFKSAATNSTLDAALRQDKIVLFLHLLGLDMAGHSYRPMSMEYLHNIKIVDQGVERITKTIEEFYDDDKTAFVFTADHGMSDWGSHGDGHPDNTRTPLVAWGSGVKRPAISKGGKAPGHEDGFSHDWGLDHVARHDVAQADVAPLMAYLAGLEFPTNSEGKLPLSYIAAGPAEQAEAAFVNAQGILEMYRVKEEEKKATELNFKPYSAFGMANSSIESRIASVRTLIEQGDYEKSIAQSHDLLHLGLEGLRYLQTYDWLFLRALVTLGYLGWMAFAITTVIDLHVLHGKTEVSRSPAVTAAFGAVLVVLYSFLILRRSPPTYYAYATFPIVFWEEVVARRRALVAGGQALLGNIGPNELIATVIKFVASILFLEGLVSYQNPLSLSFFFVFAIPIAHAFYPRFSLTFTEKSILFVTLPPPLFQPFMGPGF